jgi:dTDP-4-amino-4,6-dideoxygalactose transaminase
VSTPDPPYAIPFNRPCLAGREQEYMRRAIASGHLSGDGEFTRACHAYLAQSLSVPAALLTTSCTHALEMAAMLLRIAPGDEVIVPSFTFVSTANAFLLRGARPVFADIHPDTLNLDESRLDGLMTPRTRAVVAMHYAGVGCEMDAILATAGNRGVAVVEDNAHGLFGRYKGKYLGTFGCLATQSFHETKNFTCGEGGALLINDPRYIERAEVIREKGTHRTRFLRGEVNKYTWVDMGSSYLPSDLLAAFLLAQLEARDHIQARRKRLWERYAEGLRDWADDRGVRLPAVPGNREQPFHMFYLILPSRESRQGLIAHLKERGILAVFHYLPLHLSAMGRSFGGVPGGCPVTEDVSDRLVRLPFFNDLTEEEQTRVVDAIRDSPGLSAAAPRRT